VNSAFLSGLEKGSKRWFRVLFLLLFFSIIHGAPKIFFDENQGFIDILGKKFLFNLKKN